MPSSGRLRIYRLVLLYILKAALVCDHQRVGADSGGTWMQNQEVGLCRLESGRSQLSGATNSEGSDHLISFGVLRATHKVVKLCNHAVPARPSNQTKVNVARRAYRSNNISRPKRAGHWSVSNHRHPDIMVAIYSSLPECI